MRQVARPDFVVRLDRALIDRLRSVIARHPYRPTLRATLERSVELMIEDLEEEIRNVK